MNQPDIQGIATRFTARTKVLVACAGDSHSCLAGCKRLAFCVGLRGWLGQDADVRELLTCQVGSLVSLKLLKRLKVQPARDGDEPELRPACQAGGESSAAQGLGFSLDVEAWRGLGLSMSSSPSRP